MTDPTPTPELPGLDTAPACPECGGPYTSLTRWTHDNTCTIGRQETTVELIDRDCFRGSNGDPFRRPLYPHEADLFAPLVPGLDLTGYTFAPDNPRPNNLLTVVQWTSASGPLPWDVTPCPPHPFAPPGAYAGLCLTGTTRIINHPFDWFPRR